MSNTRMQQLISLLYLDKNIVTSKGVLKYQSEMLIELKKRIEHKIFYYDTNELVQTNLKFLNNIIDKWYTNNI